MVIVKVNVPIVFRGANGAGVGVAAQHSQDFAAWYAHCPGLKLSNSLCSSCDFISFFIHSSIIFVIYEYYCSVTVSISITPTIVVLYNNFILLLSIYTVTCKHKYLKSRSDSSC